MDMDEFWALVAAPDVARGAPARRCPWLAAPFPLPREGRRLVWETARP